MATPRLSVIRGGQRNDGGPPKPQQDTQRSSSDECANEHSADDGSVISIMDGWLRVFERQARATKP